MPKSAPSSRRPGPGVDEGVGAALGSAVRDRADDPSDHGGTAGGGDAAPTPLDGADFLAANRRNRERIRAEAAAKAPPADADSDRVPRKLDASTALSAGTSRRRPRVSRTLVVALLGALVVGLAAATGVLAYQRHAADSRANAVISDGDRQTVIDTAKRYAATVTTYDPADYADLDKRIRAVSTPEFATTYIEASADARAGNGNAKAVSKATAETAGIVSMTEGKAVVLVALDQTVTSPELESQVPEGIPYQSRVQVTLEKRDGRWLLSSLSTI